ncbi:ParA family protein [Rufibacter roseolus]|uniref:ParA family protein n=1 Tax=Rufibacter roseolus TaxID=2817375 RepID=UPI001B307D19|nr:ParA family protein [Rufibacter roseolus]
MAKIFAIALNKGGVGKSTTAAYLGAALARQGKKVLLIDLDSQRNCTDCFPPEIYGLEETGNPENHVGKLLTGAITVTKAVHQANDQLDIIPSHKDLLEYEEAIANKPRREDLLRKAIRSYADENYDYVLIDTPPHLGLATYNALYTADYYLVPVTAEYFSYDGIDALIRKANAVTEDTGLEFAGVVLTRYNEKERGKALQAIASAIKEETYYKTFKTYIRKNAKIVEAQIEHLDLFTYAPESAAAEDYTNLALELMDRYGR